MTEPVTRPTLEGTTPGPWETHVDLQSGGTRILAGTKVVATLARGVGRWAPDTEANATLIAQAPALAAENQKLSEENAALRSVLKAARQVVAPTTVSRMSALWALDAALKALASAAPLLEGEGASK